MRPSSSLWIAVSILPDFKKANISEYSQLATFGKNRYPCLESLKLQISKYITEIYFVFSNIESQYVLCNLNVLIMHHGKVQPYILEIKFLSLNHGIF